MIKNYFKVAWRNIRSRPGFSFINITGLAVGMAGAILIFAWVQNEYSYDEFHANKNSLYQVWYRNIAPGYVNAGYVTPAPMAKALKNDYPEVKNVSRIYWSEERLFNYGDKTIKATGNDVDKPFLSMFSFPLLKGNPNHALDDLNSIVITEKLAHKIFGDTDPINKLVKINSKSAYKVTGVLKNLPNNTQFDFEYLVLLDDKVYGGADSWNTGNYITYVQLQANAGISTVSNKIKGLYFKYEPTNGNNTEVFLHPLKQWRLYSNFENGKVVGGRIDIVHLLVAIALIILLIACINFMNLSTAQSQKRAREVGVRKVIGATRGRLISQFLSESLIITFIAGFIAIILVEACLPYFNQITSKNLSINYSNPLFWLLFTGFILFTGLLAGSYPAFLLSGFRPVKVLKGAFVTTPNSFNPRKVLVVIQFAVAIVLVVSTIVIYRQIKFAQNRDTGYNINNLVEIPIEGDIRKNFEPIKNEMINSGAAVAMCKTSLGVTIDGRSSSGYSWEGTNKDQQRLQFSIFGTTGNLINTMGMKLVDGRDIDLASHPTDSLACLINEASVKAMEIKNPVGKYIRDGGKTIQIVGVFKDFIIRSPYVNVGPMMIIGSKSWTYNTVFRLNPKMGIAKSLQMAQEIFKKYNPSYPFTYNFVDKEYEQKFSDEQTTGKLSAIFAGLTIFISCLGLFGMAAYIAENRSKEIGIRKVLGASVAGITQMLTREFVSLVLIAIVIATPIAWYAMNKWLQSYNYRIDIGWLTFVAAGLAAIIIAILTVSFQSIKAAVANPINSIKTE
jgi:putative ABC transport system permease protein